MDGDRPQNVPEYSVSEISGAVKRALETGFGRVRVRGEITELKRYGSGHTYLSLKDEGAKLAAVVWRSAAARIGLAPENGIEVIATGRITAYGERSSYQLVIERLEYAGAGALLARIESLRARFAAEGLFDQARKRALPMLPRLLGVVTSPSGAVLHDIRTTVARRFARDLLVWPVPVQGEGAAARIAAAIGGFDRLAPGGTPPRPDVLIVARGGGSLEDLMAFNDETVVRAVAACRIPVISAVGHETDTTLIDWAADRRAPTPTAAAELAVPLRSALLADLAHRGARLVGAFGRLADGLHGRLERAARALPDLPSTLGEKRQRLDDRAHRLALALPQLLGRGRAALNGAERQLPSPRALIAARAATVALLAARERAALLRRLAKARHDAERAQPRTAPLAAGLRESAARLEGWGVRLERASAEAVSGRSRAALTRLERQLPSPHALIAARAAMVALLAGRERAALLRRLAAARNDAERARPRGGTLAASLREQAARLEGWGARLESASFEAVLRRGYALVTRPDGSGVTTAASVAAGARLRLRFADGTVGVRADGTPRTTGQGTLPL